MRRARGGATRYYDSGDALGFSAGSEVKRLRPSRSDTNFVTSWPRTLLPAASSGGEKVARPPLPGETVTMPPLTPLLPGIPTWYSQSPDNSYKPAVAMTASTRRQTPATTTRSPVIGFTPPLANVAAITARSWTVTSREHWRG